MGKCGDTLLKPRMAVLILTCINFINYIDRGIIPGASTSLRGCEYNNKTCPNINPNTTLPDNWCVACPMCNTHCSNIKTCGIQCNEKIHRIGQLGFGISETELGFLQSSFMVGYSLAAVFFGNAVHKFRPFRLMSIGLCIWTVAAFLSGYSGIICKQEQSDSSFDVSNKCGGYYLMILARILSGVGEASFATISVPFLDDVVDKKYIGLSLAIYFSAVPCGTAVGFIWGGQMSEAIGWEYAFLVEAPLMIPMAIYFFFVPHRLSESSSVKTKNQTSSENIDSSYNALLISEPYEEQAIKRKSGNNNNQSSGSYTSSSDDSLEMMEPEEGYYDGIDNDENHGMLAAVKALLSNPVYIFTCIGYSAFTAVTAGFAFYAPSFVQRNNPCLNVKGPCHNDWHFSQSSADIAFGGVVASSGLLGTAIGGKLLDYFKNKNTDSGAVDGASDDSMDATSAKLNGLQRCQSALIQVSWEAFLAVIICVLAVQSSNPTIFFCGIWLGCLVLFTTTSGVNGVLLWSVEPKNRAMSMGFSVLILHAFGDVPSPIIIGYIDDTWKDPKFTMSITSMWLVVCIVTWFTAYSTIKFNWWDVKKTRQSKNSTEKPLLGLRG
jgi:MFS transporter, Spinster family, sphingosine-1-phosphate transporter